MFSSVVTTYSARFASMVSYLLLLPIVMGAFGVDSYGVYALTASIAALFAQDFGMGNATTRFIAMERSSPNPRRMNEVATASWAFYLGAALVMSVAVVITLLLVLPEAPPLTPELRAAGEVMTWITAVNVFFLLMTSANRQLLIGVGRLVDVNVLLIAQAMLRVVLTVVVVACDLGIVWVAIADVMTTICIGALTFIVRRHRSPLLRAKIGLFRRKVFRELFSVSTSLMVLGLASTVVMQAGGVITALILPIAFTAFYAAGQRVYTVVKEVTSSLAVVALPHASVRFAEAGSQGNARLYVFGTQLGNMLMVLVLVPVVTFMPLIMTLWIGEGALEAAIVAQILSLSVLVNNNHLLAIPVMTARGRVGGYAILHTVWALSGVLLAYVLGLNLGIAGVALGMVIPVVVLEPVYVLLVLRETEASTRDFVVGCLVKPYLLPLAPAIALYVVAQSMPATIASAIIATVLWLVVALTLYATLGLGAADRRTLVSAAFKSRST